MSDIAQGYTASLILKPGDSYAISTSGTATVKVIYGGPTGTTTLTAQSSTFGPYDAPAKLDVAAVYGTCSYGLKGYPGSPAYVSGGVVVDQNGSPVSGYGILVAAASGDASGTADSTAIEAAIAQALASGGRLHVPAGTYVINRDVQMATGLHVTMAPGAVIKPHDSFLVPVTANSSAVVTAAPSDMARVRVGQHVLDSSANLSVGNAFGCTPGDLKVTAVDAVAGTITFSAALTANGAQSLRFYFRGNIILANGVTNWSITTGGAGGWGYLDGNRPHAYPYPIGSNDSVGNGLRIVNCSDFRVDGICGRNTRYHGGICVGKVYNDRIGRFRGENCGYRAWHYHGENVGGSVNEEVSGHAELFEADTTGVASFQAQGGEENNSGVFLTLDNVAGLTVGTVRAKDSYGAAVMLAGQASTLPASNNNSIGQIFSDNAAITLGLYSEVRNQLIGSVIGRGKYFKVTGCATLDAADGTWYYMPASGIQSTYAVRTMQLPVGTVAANSIRPGMRMFMSSGTTGMAGGGLQILKVQAGAGAGGTDLITVMRDGGTANPYTTVANGFDVYFWTCRGTGFFMDMATATKQIKGIKIGSMVLEWAGRAGVGGTLSTSECRYRDFSIGSLTIDGTAASDQWNSVAGMTIGHYMKRNATNGLPDAGATQTGGVDTLFQNCANVSLAAVYGDFTLATGSDNNVGWRFDANCRNVRMSPRGLNLPASVAAIDVVTPSGAAANAAGFQGPVVLDDPRSKTGAQLTVAGNAITRIDATACIVTRPVDAG